MTQFRYDSLHAKKKKMSNTNILNFFQTCCSKQLVWNTTTSITGAHTVVRASRRLENYRAHGSKRRRGSQSASNRHARLRAVQPLVSRWAFDHFRRFRPEKRSAVVIVNFLLPSPQATAFTWTTKPTWTNTCWTTAERCGKARTKNPKDTNGSLDNSKRSYCRRSWCCSTGLRSRTRTELTRWKWPGLFRLL